MGQAKPSAPGFRVPWARVGLVALTRPSPVQSAAGRAVGPGGGRPDDALPAARSAPAPRSEQRAFRPPRLRRHQIPLRTRPVVLAPPGLDVDTGAHCAPVTTDAP